MMKKLTTLPLLVALTIGSSNHTLFAETPAKTPEANVTTTLTEKESLTPEQILASIKYQTGKITLANGIASLDLPAGFQYLNPKDTETILVDGWGNPPDETLPLGMIVPTNLDPLSEKGWGVVITYNEDGHVSEDDADKINYDDMLKDLKKADAEDNAERVKQGYAEFILQGWAEKPHYDKATHKFYWAKEYSSKDQTNNTLNYSIRILGRKGVLVLNAVSSMKEMQQIKTEMPKVIAFTNFTPTNTYADFDSKTDDVAKYGLAALVAGGVAAKMGLFAKLAALLIAFKKIIIVGAIALTIGVKKFFSRSKSE